MTCAPLFSSQRKTDAVARPSKKAEQEAADARWMAEEARIQKLGDLFSALPDGGAKTALLDAMTDRVIELFNGAKFAEGDAILEFLPNDHAKRLLEWYFDDNNANTTFPPTSAPSEHETAQPRQVQSKPQVEEWPDGEYTAEGKWINPNRCH